MAAGDQSPTDRFERLQKVLASDLLVDAEPATGANRSFGSTALKTGAKIFAMLTKDRLVLKLPKDRVTALVNGGAGTRLETVPGRAMREWISLDPASELDWETLAREALEYVATANRGVQ